jgi:hypothetical protein
VIVIEGSWWPLVVVGQVASPDLSRQPAVLVDEHCFELSDELRVALVVAGAGAAAVKAYRELLAWLQRFERTLDQRTRRVAWVIEDDECRACTDAWLRLSRVPILNAPAASFRTMADAIGWLLHPAEAAERAPGRPPIRSFRSGR